MILPDSIELNGASIDLRHVTAAKLTVDDRALFFDIVLTASMRGIQASVGGWSEQWQFDRIKKVANALAFESNWFISCRGVDIGVISSDPPIEGYDRYFLGNFYLYPEYQNQGIGSAILQCLLRNIDKQNKDTWLTVLWKSPAISLYKRLGFYLRPELVDTSDAYIRVYERTPTQIK